MIHLIDELKIIPGVIGACIVNLQGGVRVTNLPTIFKPERLNLIGKHLLKLYATGRMSFGDLTDIILHYDESVVIARELEKNTLVFAICDPTFNQNLLTMSFNLLQEEFKLGDFSTASTLEAETSLTAAAQPPPIGLSLALQELFTEIKELLGKVLGPMAGFVFDEVAEEWMEQGVPEFSRIEELIKLINREIDDQDKIDNYRQLISSKLKDFQKG